MYTFYNNNKKKKNLSYFKLCLLTQPFYLTKLLTLERVKGENLF